MFSKLATKQVGLKVSSLLLALSMVFADVFVVLERGLIRAPEAEAAVGDFSIFRTATGGQSVAGTGVDVLWDTSVTESANIPLDANDSDIT